ncbi:hypothetical protein NC653_015382 [Populus alba x Populus x berolinensis]|uniref:Uncharacterized protein n=1 Tax=Populus alba x Populus x berolinensis TaxID=444605 RepID=A0AAD6VY18_9ROSI|nr:hypothetical protein NC653_015382 [Populus alba x Populus x berolinensis]
MKAMALCWTNDAASSCSAFSFAFFISVFTDCFRVPVAFEMMKMLAGFILTDFWVVPFMCRNEDNSKANSCPCVAEAFSDFCLSLCSRFCSPVYAGFFLCYLLSPGYFFFTACPLPRFCDSSFGFSAVFFPISPWFFRVWV